MRPYVVPRTFALPMVTPAQSFRLSATVVDGGAASSPVDNPSSLPHSDLTIYEVTWDPTVAVETVINGSMDGLIEIHESFDVAGVLSLVAFPLTPIRQG